MDFVIEPMTTEDWEQVRAIYEEGIRGGNATFETSTPSWEQWNQAHLPICRLVARRAGAVVGWAALTPVSARKAYTGVAEVSLYVSEKGRGKGVGTALQEELTRQSEAHGIWTPARGRVSGERCQPGASEEDRIPRSGPSRTHQPTRWPLARHHPARAPQLSYWKGLT